MKHGERGAILVETALVVGMILTFLLFSVQMGVLGFIQVTADASSFVAARVETLSTAPAQAYTAGKFDQLRPSDVSTAVAAPAPISTVPVNYGYNVPSADPNQYQYQRVGGYSQLQPVLKAVTVTPSKVVSVAGILGHVNGTDTEAQWTECGAHFNVAGSTKACGDSADPANFEANYFSQGENTPPYYVGFNQMNECLANFPWGSSNGDCPSGGSSPGNAFFGLGVAEQLDVYNWGRTGAGVQNATDAFYEAGCHQGYYAAMGNVFQSYPTLRALYQANQGGLFNQFVISPSNSFQHWVGFSDVNFPKANQDINSIYDWDIAVVANSPMGSDDTTPSANCTVTP